MESNNENRTNVLLLTVIGVATLLVAVIGATFAYFTANLSNQETATTITVKAGTLTIAYATGNSSILADNVVPQVVCTASAGPNQKEPCIADAVDYPYGKPVVTKDFTITGNNSTTSVMPYTLKLIVQTNSFSTNGLSYTLTGQNIGTGTSVSPVPNGTIVVTAVSTAQGITTGNTQSIALGSGYFTGPISNAVHSYVLKIYFTDNGSNQDADKGKTFTGYVETTVEAAYTTTT